MNIKSFFSKFSLTFFKENLKENVIILVAEFVLFVLAVVLGFKLKWFIVFDIIKVLLHWYVLIPCILIGIMGFFFDVNSKPLQRVLKVFMLPGVILGVLIALGGLLLFASGRNSQNSGVSADDYVRNMELQSASDSYKRAAHEKEVAESLLTMNPDNKEAKFTLAKAEREMANAMGDMMSAKTGNKAIGGAYKTAAGNKFTASLSNDKFGVANGDRQMGEAFGNYMKAMGHESAGDSYKTGARNRAVGAASDNDVMNQKEIGQKQMDYAIADMMSEQTGNKSIGDAYKTAASNKATASEANDKFGVANGDRQMGEAFANYMKAMGNESAGDSYKTGARNRAVGAASNNDVMHQKASGQEQMDFAIADMMLMSKQTDNNENRNERTDTVGNSRVNHSRKKSIRQEHHSSLKQERALTPVISSYVPVNHGEQIAYRERRNSENISIEKLLQNESAMLRRAYIFLEDGELERADQYLEKVLDEDPENAFGYLGKMLLEYNVSSIDDLPDSYRESKYYKRILKYGSDELIALFEQDEENQLVQNNEDESIDKTYHLSHGESPYEKESVFADVQKAIESQIFKKNSSSIGYSAWEQKQDYFDLEDQIAKGKNALTAANWDTAKRAFNEIIAHEPKNAEAYLGAFLAENKARKLSDYSKMISNRYVDSALVKISACDEETEHIRSMAEHYSVGPRLSRTDIEKRYSFDRIVLVSASDRKHQKEEALAELDSNSLLNKAKLYADVDLKSKISNMQASIIAIMDERIDQAEETDSNLIQTKTEEYQDFIKAVDEKIINEYAEVEKVYSETKEKMESAKFITEYNAVIKSFDSISEYKDAKQLCEECKKKREKYLEIVHADALKKRKAESMKRTIIGTLSGFALVAVIIGLVLFLAIIPSKRYETAKASMEQGDYQTAKELLEKIGKYKDAEKLLAVATEKVLYNNKYEEAIVFMNEGDYISAIALINELGTNEELSILNAKCTALSYRQDGSYEEALSILEPFLTNEDCYSLYVDIYNEELQKVRDNAKQLWNDGKYEDAIYFLEPYTNDDDCYTIFTAICKEYIPNALQSAEVGDIILLGEYERDNNNENGPECIEWLVIAKEDNKVLLLSKEIIEGRIFDYARPYYSRSDIRKWLNESFYDTALGNCDVNIVYTTVETESDTTVEDRVFLLSQNEVEQYSLAGERATATAYVAALNVVSHYEDYYAWWLRDCTDKESYFVSVMGRVSSSIIKSTHMGVRPAMWISIE